MYHTYTHNYITHLLSSSVPYIEFDWSTIGVKGERVNLDSQSSNVFLFKFSRQMSLDKGGLSNSSISYKDQFEFGRRTGLRL